MDVFIAQVRYYDGLTRYAVFDGTGVLATSFVLRSFGDTEVKRCPCARP